jgi:hypothetical protein
MNLTDEQIRSGFEEEEGFPMPDGDFGAFKRLMAAFGVTEATSYADAKEQFLKRLDDPKVFATGLANISLAK